MMSASMEAQRVYDINQAKEGSAAATKDLTVETWATDYFGAPAEAAPEATSTAAAGATVEAPAGGAAPAPTKAGPSWSIFKGWM